MNLNQHFFECKIRNEFGVKSIGLNWRLTFLCNLSQLRMRLNFVHSSHPIWWKQAIQHCSHPSSQAECLLGCRHQWLLDLNPKNTTRLPKPQLCDAGNVQSYCCPFSIGRRCKCADPFSVLFQPFSTNSNSLWTLYGCNWNKQSTYFAHLYINWCANEWTIQLTSYGLRSVFSGADGVYCFLVVSRHSQSFPLVWRHWFLKCIAQ